MNIAFDAVAILGPMSKNRGIGNYSLAQFQEMIARDQENQYFFFNVFEPFTLGDYPNLTEECFDCGKDRGLLNIADGLVYENLVRSYIEKNKIDVFYITSPFDDNVPVYRKEWFDGVKTVATVYDIIPYIFKEHYFNNHIIGAAWYLERIEMLRWMDKLLVISQSVKDDLVEYLDFKEDNIEVIWGAPNKMFKPVDISPTDAERIKKKYRIRNKFIMCTGGDDERKNIAGLIEAYAGLSEHLKREYSLVIVCKLQKAAVERYSNLAKSFGIRDCVSLTNFVSDEELSQLYNMASLVAFPSKYEGFGLPVVEAWACHTPVLTSDNSSLVQIAGDAATIVNADDIMSITRGLEEALQEECLKLMMEKGKERLALFQWPVVADRVVHEINKMKRENITAQKRMRLAYFSPLPPQESGIADYSVDVLNALSDQIEIDVFIDDGYEADCQLNSNICVYNHQEFHARAGEYDQVLFQMGNSLYHYYMYPYLRKYGGVLVLHDYNMHGVGQCIALHVKDDNLRTYEEYLSEDYPKEFVENYLDGIRKGKKVDTSYELNGFVTNYADKIIVHSEYAREKLLERNIGRNVKVIPHYAKIEEIRNRESAKHRFGFADDSIVFAAFGHVHETKRIIPILKAAIKLMKQNEKVYIQFVGKLDDQIKDEFKKLCDNSGVADRIAVTGYVDLEEFVDYIDATDVCLNLRHPYNGENSGSLARILAKRKCAVVNDIGSFGEVPDECCVKLPAVDTMSSAKEEKLIYQTMAKLAEDIEYREEIAENARRYAEEVLDLRKIAEQYSEFIFDDRKHTVTEDVINQIREQEVFGKQYSQQEIRGIAKTLAYCVNR